MGKPEVNRRPLTLIGVLAALGLAAALAVATPSAAGAQTRGHYEGFKVVADHLNNPARPLAGAWPRTLSRRGRLGAQ